MLAAGVGQLPLPTAMQPPLWEREHFCESQGCLPEEPPASDDHPAPGRRRRAFIHSEEVGRVGACGNKILLENKPSCATHDEISLSIPDGLEVFLPSWGVISWEPCAFVCASRIPGIDEHTKLCTLHITLEERL